MLSLFIINRITIDSSVSVIKEKVFFILFFLFFIPLLAIFISLNLFYFDALLLESILKHEFFLFLKESISSNNFFNSNFNLYYDFKIYCKAGHNALVLNSIFYNLLGGFDFISLLFFFMSHVVSFMVIVFSTLYYNFHSENYNIKSLTSFKITLFSVISMTIMMDLLFLTDNLLFIFFLAELSLVPLAFLVTKDSTIFWRNTSEALYENKRPLALYYLVFFTIVSGGFGFIGIILVYFLFGTISLHTLESFDFNSIALLSKPDSFFYFNLCDSTTLILSFIFLLLWIIVKVPLAPVHIWLPKAHVEGSTESSMILAGIILKVTVYVFIRLNLIPSFMILFENYKHYLLAIAATTAILGSVGSLLATDMKRITAYSSVSHMGIILGVGFYINSLSFALAPFLILLLTHTFVSTAMFMLIGCIYKTRYGVFISRNRLAYSGFLFIYPIYFLFGAIIFSNLNIPLTMGFIGEVASLVVVVKSGLTLGFIFCLSSFILLLPMLSMVGQVLMGPIRSNDFFKTSINLLSANFSIFTKKLVFTKLLSNNNNFLQFYSNKRFYFWFIFLIVFGFGIFPFLFLTAIEDSLLFFDLSLTKNLSFSPYSSK